MAGFSQGADDFHFVMVLPEGINQSFNAGTCCGDAHQLGIHDADFLNYIRHELSDEFDFLQAEYTYGIGWDNGALLLIEVLTKYPKIFRGIAPIAGYMMQSSIPPTIGKGIGIMMHHSLDDSTMRPSGCCKDRTIPECRSDLNTMSCVSVLDSFDLWVKDVNLCDGEAQSTNTNTRTHLVGGKDDHFYSLSVVNGSASIALETAINEEGEDFSKQLSSSDAALSVTQQTESHVCLTTTSTTCIATSTLCLYKDMGHFNGFVSTPYMSQHIMEFLARDACGINDGVWSFIPRKSGGTGGHNKRVCGCSTNGFDGVFCLDKLNDDGEQKSFVVLESQSSIESKNSKIVMWPYWVSGILGGLMLAAAATICYVTLKRHRKEKRRFSRSSATNAIEMYDTWRRTNLNPYRDHFKGNADCVHQPIDNSMRSLDPGDVELLQIYRRQSVDSDGEHDPPEKNRGIDLELLNKYRQRQYSDLQINRANSTKSNASGNLSKSSFADEQLFESSEEYVDNILRDVAMS
jgi:poly(3-hydroxybutyrate) depolymerase